MAKFDRRSSAPLIHFNGTCNGCDPFSSSAQRTRITYRLSSAPLLLFHPGSCPRRPQIQVVTAFCEISSTKKILKQAKCRYGHHRYYLIVIYYYRRNLLAEQDCSVYGTSKFIADVIVLPVRRPICTESASDSFLYFFTLMFNKSGFILEKELKKNDPISKFKISLHASFQLSHLCSPIVYIYICVFSTFDCRS